MNTIYLHRGNQIIYTGNISATLRGTFEYRSASSSRLVVPIFRLSRVGSRTFNVSGPWIWNGLPEDVVSAPTFSSFRRRLKPFLFQQSYPDIIIYCTFDTIVIFVAMFNTQATLKITELN